MIVLSVLSLLSGAPGPGPVLVQDGTTQAAPAPAARAPARRRPAPPRRRVAPIQPLPTPEPAPAAPRADLAPMPNRGIEGPSGPRAAERPTLRPDLIEPRDTPDRQQRAGGAFTDRQDRLFRDPAPGARLQIPFTY